MATGADVCPRSGEFCTVQTSSGPDSTLAIVLGVILPVTLLLVVLAIIFAVLLLGYMRYKRPKVILKVLSIPSILSDEQAHAPHHRPLMLDDDHTTNNRSPTTSCWFGAGIRWRAMKA
jgi:hypothetical protein